MIPKARCEYMFTTIFNNNGTNLVGKFWVDRLTDRDILDHIFILYEQT